MDSIRQTVGKKIEELARTDRSVIAMTADLSSSVGFNRIKEEIPSQYIQCGIAEQEMMSMAAGLALNGLKPFCGSFAAFHPGRNWDQLRTSVCYNQAPVRIISSHYGLNVGGDGATHQCLEYLALTLPLPHIDVLTPFNNSSAEWSIKKAYDNNSYSTIIFQPRESQSEEVEEIDGDFDNGYVYLYNQQPTLIISYGLTVSECFKLTDCAVDFLFLIDLKQCTQQKIGPILHKYNRIMIVEEHQMFGGIGSIIFEIIAKSLINVSRIDHVGIPFIFGKSAPNASELYDMYSLSSHKLREIVTH